MEVKEESFFREITRNLKLWAKNNWKVTLFYNGVCLCAWQFGIWV